MALKGILMRKGDDGIAAKLWIVLRKIQLVQNTMEELVTLQRLS